MTSSTERPRIPIRSLAIAILLAGVLLYFALRGISWDEVLAAIGRAQVIYLAFATIVLTVSFSLRALRWRVLLSATRLLSPIDVFWATTAGYMGNSFLPARAGEILRTVLLGRRTGISKSFILATALTERLVDAVTLVLISLVALTTVAGVPDWLRAASQVMAVLGLVGMVLLLALPRLEPLIKRVLARLLPAGRIYQRITELLGQCLLGMGALQHPQRALKFAGLTVVIWLCDALIAMLVALSIGLTLALPEAMLLLAALGLASAAPSTPGYVGIYQSVAVTVLPLFGFSQNEALAYILLFQAVTYTVVITWGPLGFWRLTLAAARAAATSTHRS